MQNSNPVLISMARLIVEKQKKKLSYTKNKNILSKMIIYLNNM